MIPFTLISLMYNLRQWHNTNKNTYQDKKREMADFFSAIVRGKFTVLGNEGKQLRLTVLYLHLFAANYW
jgi:hypothetical protein